MREHILPWFDDEITLGESWSLVVDGRETSVAAMLYDFLCIKVSVGWISSCSPDSKRQNYIDYSLLLQITTVPKHYNKKSYKT